MQSFKATVRKKYRLVRGHLTYVTRISVEMLRPRTQSFVLSVHSPYQNIVGKKHQMPNTSTYFVPSEPSHGYSFARIANVHSESYTTEAFCECGCHETLYVERSKPSDYYMNIAGISCPACDKPYSEFSSHGFSAQPYSEKSTPLSITGVQLDCVALFDDFLEKEKLSLKFMGHMTYYNPNRVKLYSSDHVAKLIYSHKNGRMYFYDKKSVYDVTYRLDSYVTSISENFGLYSTFKMANHTDAPHVFELTKKMMDNEEEVSTESPYLVYYFSDFFRRVYDVLDKPRWAPDFDEFNPTRSLKSTLMSIISPLTQSMFPHYDQNALSSLLGKQLRHFKKESDALDMMLDQPSGHYRKLVRSAIDVNEVSILNRVAFSMAGLFKEPSHLNTILTHASQLYREVVGKGLYFSYSAETFESNLAHTSSQRLSYLRKAERFDFSSEKRFSGRSLSISRFYRDKHSGSVDFPVTISLKNNRPVFNLDEDCQHLHGLRKRFGISDRRLVDIIKYELEWSIKYNPLQPLNFVHTIRDMNRLLDLIRSSCAGYTPKLGLDMYEAEKRLVNLSKRVGIKDYPFDYSDARLALEDEISGHRFRLPKTSSELMNIGNRLDHCVGGYHSVVQSGGTTIVVVEKDGCYVLAIEVISGKVTQVKGMGNNIGYHIPDQLKKTVKKWIQKNKLTLSTKDLSYSHGKPVPYVPSDYRPIEKISFDQSSLDAIYRARIEMNPRPSKRISEQEARSILEREIQTLKDSLVGHEAVLSRVSEPDPFERYGPNLTEDDLPF